MFAGKAKSVRAKRALAQEYQLDPRFIPDAWADTDGDNFYSRYYALQDAHEAAEKSQQAIVTKAKRPTPPLITKEAKTPTVVKGDASQAFHYRPEGLVTGADLIVVWGALSRLLRSVTRESPSLRSASRNWSSAKRRLVSQAHGVRQSLSVASLCPGTAACGIATPTRRASPEVMRVTGRCASNAAAMEGMQNERCS